MPFSGLVPVIAWHGTTPLILVQPVSVLYPIMPVSDIMPVLANTCRHSEETTIMYRYSSGPSIVPGEKCGVPATMPV